MQQNPPAGGVPSTTQGSATEPTRKELRETYGELAGGGVARVQRCCVPNADGPPEADATDLPTEVRELALGCGDPVTLAALEPGETVLDLGSGAGMDSFLAARAVGENGHVIGVDMTPEMVEKARAAEGKMGVDNVEFRLGEIEHLPVADETADVVISNCVINLSPDKHQVFAEAFRALKPGGRLALSEMMVDGPLPEPMKAALGDAAASVWEEPDCRAALNAAGFVDVEIARHYPKTPSPEDVAKLASQGGSGTGARALVQIAETGETRIVELDQATAAAASGARSFSGQIRARKPQPAPPAGR